ncbi:MAG: ATP-dependent Clp protease proteolytic subunit [Rhodoplanes sp.]
MVSLKRDYQLMAGPGAQRLAGTNRTFLIDGVAILPVTGPIFPRANMMTEYSGATSINTLTDDYRKALDSAEVGAILMLLDSPGGQVSGINAFADIVAAGTKKKYTTAFVAGSAASAAYWIASAASEIAMERTGIIGRSPRMLLAICGSKS